jgi:hypothetical protein
MVVEMELLQITKFHLPEGQETSYNWQDDYNFQGAELVFNDQPISDVHYQHKQAYKEVGSKILILPNTFPNVLSWAR